VQVRFDDGESLEAVEAQKAGTGLGPGIDKVFRKRMKVIRAAVDERDFYNLKSLHFEKLKDRGDDRSIMLNDQWRLILRLEGEAPKKVVVIRGIEDYH